jgi:hypothetical protein
MSQTTMLVARSWLAAALLSFVAMSTFALAQDATSDAAPDEEAAAATALADKQSRIADKYRRLEELLFKMEQLERGENPQRADLLREAIAHGRGEGIQLQLNALIKRLSDEDYRRAEDGQGQVKADLTALLELLQKEDRARRNASEQQRIKEYIKELDRIIRKESSIQGRTEGGADAKDLAQEQGDLAERAGDLSNKIRENEEGKPAGEQAKPNEGELGEKPSEGDPKQGEPKEGEPKEGEPQEGQPQQGEPQAGQPKEGEPQQGQPQEGQPQQGQPQEGQPQQQQPQQNQPQDQAAQQQPPNPARERIEQAQQKMKEAQQQLEKAEREGAAEKQEEARRLLEQAKAELEEILRQLREEEIERTLAQLETRFRKMLKMQEKVYDDTVALDSLNTAGEDATIPARAGKLSFEQKKIVVEVDQALELLKEEGSSSAFPEVITQMRVDMVDVTDRLAEVKLGKVTQGLEEDIIDTLKQMIEAFQQAQKDQEKRQEQQQQEQEGQQEDPGLVDMIAELKMIRAMQDRVNNRTRRYADLLENPEDLVGQATEDELQQAIVGLAEREKSCQRVTRDIVLGKNE